MTDMLRIPISERAGIEGASESKSHKCGCYFRGGEHLFMAPNGCTLHGVGNQDTVSRTYSGSGADPVSSENRGGTFVRPRGLDRVWKPKPGGTL